MKPLLYLHHRLLINSLKSIVRSPKKLIPAILIFFWFLQMVVTSVFMYLEPGYGHQRHPLIPMDYFRIEAIWSAVFAILTVVLLSTVYTALSDGLLIFTPSQIDFLFPTPINRRWTLAAKLFSDYVRMAFYIGFFVAVTRPAFGPILGQSSFTDTLAAWIGILSPESYLRIVTELRRG